MTRKDSINYKTLGECLLLYCTKVLTIQHEMSPERRTVQTAVDTIMNTLFIDNTPCYDNAIKLSNEFNSAADMLSPESGCNHFYYHLAQLCDFYAETIYELSNEEQDTLPF